MQRPSAKEQLEFNKEEYFFVPTKSRIFEL